MSHPAHTPIDRTQLDAAGLNRLAIFDLAALPPALAADLQQAVRAVLPEPPHPYRQLLLVGHGGKRLWQAVKATGGAGEHPIDEFTIATLRAWMAAQLPHAEYVLLYPAPQAHVQPALNLQALGQLAGWHQPSPLMVGIDAVWGTWFAYRAVIVAASDLPPTLSEINVSPCLACTAKPCVSSCPAGALSSTAESRLDLQKCLTWRKQPASACRLSCPARLACPVGSAHRYDADQMQHVYGKSLRCIERMD